MALTYVLSAALLLATAAAAQSTRGRPFPPIFKPAQCCAQPGTLSATGVGRRSFATSIAVVRLGVEVTGKTAAGVQAEVAKRSTQLTAFLTGQNVAKLQTTGVSLNAQRNFRVTPPTITGYRGSNTVSFEVPIPRAGAILDGAVKNGASQISSVSFKATPEVTANARRAALADAAKAARAEATVIANALGVRLGTPRSVSIGDTFTPQARAFALAEGAGGGGGVAARRTTSVVVGGDSSVTARVSIVFNI